MDIYKASRNSEGFKKDKLKKKENLLNYKSILLNFITNVSSSKLAFFYAFFAPAGTIAFNQHGCPFFMPIFKFACRWAVSKNSTLVLLKFLFVKSNYFYSALICVLRADISF